MSHTQDGPWLDRQPLILALTAYRGATGWRLLLQEHENTAVSALRPRHVIAVDLWTAPSDVSISNRDVVLSLAAALVELCNPVTEDNHRLSRS